MDKVECRLQINGNHGIPLLLSHAQHESVFGDSGIVNQDVNASKLIFYGLHHFLCLCKVGGVRGIALGFHAFGGNFLFCLFIHFEVGESNVSTFLCKSQRDSFSDTACSASDERCLTF